jgi:hypothetical protein
MGSRLRSAEVSDNNGWREQGVEGVWMKQDGGKLGDDARRHSGRGGGQMACSNAVKAGLRERGRERQRREEGGWKGSRYGLLFTISVGKDGDASPSCACSKIGCYDGSGETLARSCTATYESKLGPWQRTLCAKQEPLQSPGIQAIGITQEISLEFMRLVLLVWGLVPICSSDVLP